ncbi:uracil-DNA glycosylase, family 4 [Candidatus Thermokryptus mobilis]|uniref:Type-5 uracil-DNA glycosylase n=2 Tax=Candidatus Thermokryptus mobilis TaxID=1643428 RepID=A0A0S4N2D0_9BACT|nr:uracil-DNA glycosylase, family 4 [Candidatus Thermokryptus mobilis]
MLKFSSIGEINDKLISCKLCPRLVSWRQKVAYEKTARFKDWDYWGKPVPGFGDVKGRLLVVGLAPAAHGGNRTGRMFTGDRSGEWLYKALYKFGFANQPNSTSIDDGLKLKNCYITAIVRCAPPENKPLPSEIQNCNVYLENEIKLLKRVKVIVTLGQLSFKTTLKTLQKIGFKIVDGRLKFFHGNEIKLSNGARELILISSYHPSQRNTFTHKLTEEMFDQVFKRTRFLTDVLF